MAMVMMGMISIGSTLFTLHVVNKHSNIANEAKPTVPAQSVWQPEDLETDPSVAYSSSQLLAIKKKLTPAERDEIYEIAKKQLSETTMQQFAKWFEQGVSKQQFSKMVQTLSKQLKKTDQDKILKIFRKYVE
jgi:hypothetical protein